MGTESSLLGKSDRELRMIAGDATHQHFKGGLYRLVGQVFDADTGGPARNSEGLLLVLYEHCYPYDRGFWVRSAEEFFGDSESGEWRFRKLQI